MNAQAPDTGNLYDIILRFATLPVLLILIVIAWFITNYLMNPRWQQGRRNRQIRKAVAARQMLRAEATTAQMENNASLFKAFAEPAVSAKASDSSGSSEPSASAVPLEPSKPSEELLEELPSEKMPSVWTQEAAAVEQVRKSS